MVVYNDWFLGDFFYFDDGNFWLVNDWCEVIFINGINVSNCYFSVIYVSSIEFVVFSFSGVFVNSVSNIEEV